MFVNIEGTVLFVNIAGTALFINIAEVALFINRSGTALFTNRAHSVYSVLYSSGFVYVMFFFFYTLLQKNTTNFNLSVEIIGNYTFLLISFCVLAIETSFILMFLLKNMGHYYYYCCY